MVGLNVERQKALYTSGVYLEHSPDWSEQEAAEKSRCALQLFKKANLNNIQSILDVGCGSGGVLDGICAGSPSVTRAIGIDTAPEAIEIGIGLRGPNSKIELLVTRLDQISERFDLVMASHVIEHVSNYDEFLDELSKRSNLLYINIPIEINVFYAARKNSHRTVFEKYGHVNFYTETFFDEYVKMRGYSIVAKGYGTEFRSQDRRGILGYAVYFLRETLGYFSRSFAMRMLGGFTYQVILRKDAS